MEWMLFFGGSCVAILLAIHSMLRSMLFKMKETYTRIELIHQYLVYHRLDKVSPVSIIPEEKPTSRSESAKKMWAKRKSKQVTQKPISEKPD